MCEVGSDRIFETAKSGEFSGFELSVILFLWENEKKSGAQRPISIFLRLGRRVGCSDPTWNRLKECSMGDLRSTCCL